MFKNLEFRNTISYCTRCAATLLWNDSGRPELLKIGNRNLAECLDFGCSLYFLRVPVNCCNQGESDLVRLSLVRMGLSEEEASDVTANLIFGHHMAAA
jgi:hypothetical protein